MSIKLLTWLVMPLTQVFWLLLLAFCLRWRWPRLARSSIVLAMLLLLLWSLPVVSQSLRIALESRAGEPPGPEVHTRHALVLGGMLSPPALADQQPNLHGSIDRAWQAARLVKAGRVQHLWLLGGNQQQTSTPAESVVVRELMLQWGVPAAAMTIETSSRNTRENARALAARWPDGSPWLITSGWHMPRARAEFACAGLQVTPYPVEVSFYAIGGLGAWLPSAAALAESTLMLKEWLGLAVVHWRCGRS